MTHTRLGTFLDELEATGDLKRISAPVNSQLEITEISRRVLAAGGPALLFEHVIKADGTRSAFPVLANLFGTVARVAQAIGRKPEELRAVGEALAFLRQPQPPGSLKEAVGMLPIAKQVLSMAPKTVTRAPVHEVVIEGDAVDLSMLPIQGCWPGEPAPLITWPLVVTEGPKKKGEDAVNLGIYRMQYLNPKQAIMRWLKHRGGAQQHQRWGGISRAPMPAAIVIGADPATILAAVTPVPETLSEYAFSGLLRGKKLELVACKTIPLKVPAEAEIVIEGYVSLDDYADEGPYGDHTGYYNSVEKFPVFTATAITHRKGAVYHSTYTGRPPDEPAILGEALNELFIPLFQQQFPEVVDFWLPPEGCSYRIAVVSIRKAYAGHAKRIMMGVWSYLRQFMYTKWVIIVDEDINCRDWKDVMWAVSTRMDPARDITLIEGTPIDYLDFASPVSGIGSKIGLDATNKMEGEVNREWGEKIRMDEEIVARIDALWPSLGLEGKK